MLSYTELKAGVIFLLDGQPYQVLESSFLRMQQRKPVNQTRIKNLITGKIISRNFQPSDNFPEAEIERQKVVFVYNHRDKYIFSPLNDKSQRFEIEDKTIGTGAKFLKPNTEVDVLKFENQIISVALPVKMDFEVTDAPPGIKGDTATGGTKTVTLETGAEINAPLFINKGDIVRVNTQTGEYGERISKA